MKPVDHLKNTLRKKGVERLTGHYKVKVKIHPKYPNLHMFKYDQLESPMGSKVVQACRGIILDADDDWKTICHTYDRFFNAGEGHAAEIDWATAKVYEKADGSLCQVWFYDGSWQISTKGSPDAGGEVFDHGFTFQDLFWKTWIELGYKLPHECEEVVNPKELCFAFELLTPYNQVVVRHKNPDLVLHGIRRIAKYCEYEVDPNLGSYVGYKIIRPFDFNYTNEIEKALEGMSGMEQEGFVVVDGSFNRIKMKCSDYVIKHRLVSSFSQRNILDAVRQNDVDEVITHFPQFKDSAERWKKKLDAYINHIKEEYRKIKHIQSQKEFAKEAKKTSVSSALFFLRSKKADSPQEFALGLPIKKLEERLLPY